MMQGADRFDRGSEGQDRDGRTLLDFLLAGASMHADEFYALANVWIQRSRKSTSP